jgi:hypothetical protein
MYAPRDSGNAEVALKAGETTEGPAKLGKA